MWRCDAGLEPPALLFPLTGTLEHLSSYRIGTKDHAVRPPLAGDEVSR